MIPARRRSAFVGWASLLVAAVACGPSRTATPSPPAAERGLGSATRDASAPAAACDELRAPRPAAAGEPSSEGAAPDADTVSPREKAWSDDPKVASCEVTIENLEQATAAVLALPTPRAPATNPKRAAGGAIVGLDKVQRRFALTPEETTRLGRDGVLVPARIHAGAWSDALHDVWQSELPLWVSADAIFFAVYASNDKLVARIEEASLVPHLEKALSTMHCALPRLAATWPAETTHDVDLYLTVARTLLAGAPAASATGVDAEAKAIAERITKAEGLSPLDVFGRRRLVDWSQYQPRGHYAGQATLEAFFRAAMFLSRFELNVVSRSSRSSADSPTPDPRETPREALDALALAELARSSNAGEHIDAIDRAWRTIAGRREDLSVADLASLRVRAKIGSLASPDAFDKLKTEIGSSFRRTARLHPMPEGSNELPAIATLLGARITPDTVATRPLVHSEVADRHLISPFDLAFMLGHDRAKSYLTEDLARHPNLEAKLAVARKITASPSTTEDLYGPWLGAIRGLAVVPPGATPSFMQSPAFQDLRIDGAIAAYAQLRHNNVLTVGQGYDEGGCAIPDAYVDPVPDVYDALADYARRGKALAPLVDPEDVLRLGPYFTRLEKTLGVLSKIARWELSGEPLPAEAKRWLDLVVELRPYGGTGGPPSFTGWWFDLFRLRQEGLGPATIIADTFTSSHDGKILYVGTHEPQMGLFVVDTGGPRRVMVGPVADAFAHVGPLDKRLTDADAPKTKGTAPWGKTYRLDEPPAPPLLVLQKDMADPDRANPEKAESSTPPPASFEVKSTRALGAVTIEALDHHRRVYASQTLAVGTKATRFRLPSTAPKKKGAPDDAAPDGMEAIRVRAAGAILEIDLPHQPLMEGGPVPLEVGFGGMAAPAAPAKDR
ncbi:MAG: DUF3160 domain-containing protein [Deltaproteobacteria bacterium]|nr:DUF3160 domain-containing protein [Deltaproteobacteria bacterium]